MSGVTGDKPLAQNTQSVSFACVAIIKQVDLASASHAINDRTYSGKEAGTAVMVKMTVGGAIVMAIAQGSAPNSAWIILGDNAASPVTSVVPA